MKKWANLHWKDLCCEVLLLLKTEVLCEVLAALGQFSVSWDWMQVLAMCQYHAGTRQMDCAGWLALEMGNVGCPPVRYIRYSLFVWVAGLTTLPASLRAESLATASPSCVLLWAESVPASPGGFGHKGQSPVSTAKVTWLMLYFDSGNDSFPCNTISSHT